MDDLVKEVLDYINPKVQTEQVPDKKGKAPAKGKVEEAPVDPYAGMNTALYKEIGAKIKQLIGDTDIHNGQIDLVNLIEDDELLVRLFAEKLKLMFHKDKEESVKEEEMKASITKEKELLAQLKEIEEQNRLTSPDPKAAKKQAPNKGKGGVSEE